MTTTHHHSHHCSSSHLCPRRRVVPLSIMSAVSSSPSAASLSASSSPSSPPPSASSQLQSQSSSAVAASSSSSSHRAKKKRKGKASSTTAAATAPAKSSQPHQSQSLAHSHSHDGQSCGGHNHDSSASSSSSSSSHHRFGADDDEALHEATHFCTVIFHYLNYHRHSFVRLQRRLDDYRVIPTVLQQLVPSFDDGVRQSRAAIVANHAFIREIVSHRYVFHNSDGLDYDALEQHVESTHDVDEEQMSRIRSTLRQCMRDWSVEGAAERDACYGPILRELERLYPDVAKRGDVRVLVPGCGLGRLVWETSNVFTIYPHVHDAKNVYDRDDALRPVQIPDVDPSSLPDQGRLSMMAGDWMDIMSDLPSSYVHGAYDRKMKMAQKQRMRAQQDQQNERYQQQMAAKNKSKEKEAKSNATTTASTPAAAATSSSSSSSSSTSDDVEFIPDPVRGSSSSSPSSSAASDDSPTSNACSYDVFASCYFIDCSTNILECMRTIAYVLKEGGYFINYGPLLYHFSDVPSEVSLDLTWSELRRAIPYFGLELVREELNQESSYTNDVRSMLRPKYYCISCTWKKVGEDQTKKPLSIKRIDEPKSAAWQNRLALNDVQRSTIAVNAASSAVIPYLASTSTLARRLHSSVVLPSGVMIDVYSIPSADVSTFIMQCITCDKRNVGKIVHEGIEMLAILD